MSSMIDRATGRMVELRYVVGPDLDVDLCKSLVEGDHVLMEINGVRYQTSDLNPMVVEQPWHVVENNWVENWDNPTPVITGQLVLRHDFVQQPMVLKYEKLLNLPTGQPAVFKASKSSNPDLPNSPLYVILQMVAYKIPAQQVNKRFPFLSKKDQEGLEEALDDDRVKVEFLQNWASQLKRGVNESGWKYNSVKRLAMRSAIPLEAIKAFIDEDYDALLKIPDEQLKRFRNECHWLFMLLKQNSYIVHDIDREFVKPESEK